MTPRPSALFARLGAPAAAAVDPSALEQARRVMAAARDPWPVLSLLAATPGAEATPAAARALADAAAHAARLAVRAEQEQAQTILSRLGTAPLTDDPFWGLGDTRQRPLVYAALLTALRRERHLDRSVAAAYVRRACRPAVAGAAAEWVRAGGRHRARGLLGADRWTDCARRVYDRAGGGEPGQRLADRLLECVDADLMSGLLDAHDSGQCESVTALRDRWAQLLSARADATLLAAAPAAQPSSPTVPL